MAGRKRKGTVDATDTVSIADIPNGDKPVDGQTICVSNGTILRIAVVGDEDNSDNTKEGKDIAKKIEVLRKDKYTLENDIEKLAKSVDSATKRRKQTIELKIKAMHDELALAEDSLSKTKANIVDMLAKCESEHTVYEITKAKTDALKENWIKEEQEYVRRMDNMRKELNSLVLVAKHKVDEEAKNVEKIQSQHKKMELDINENQKEKEKLRRVSEDLSKMDEALNSRARVLKSTEDDLQKKAEYFEEGQKRYQEKYEQRESFYKERVKEYNENIVKLAEEQKNLAENWENFKQAKAKLDTSDRNKKRMG